MSALSNFFNNLKKLKGNDRNFVTRIASISGLSRATLNGYLNEQGDPQLSTAENVASALGVSLYELIGKSKPASAPPREPTAEEMTAFILGRLGIPEKKLRILSSVLSIDADDTILDSLLDALPPASEKNKFTSSL